MGALSRRLTNMRTETIHDFLKKNKVKYITVDDIKSGMIPGIKKEVLSDLLDANNLIIRLAAFLKNMSQDEPDDFDFLDEAEWRVVCYEDDLASQVQPGRLVAFGQPHPVDENWESAAQIIRNPTPPPSFFLKFQPDELSLVVLPDDETRSLVWASTSFQQWISFRHGPLQLLTGQECMRF